MVSASLQQSLLVSADL